MKKFSSEKVASVLSHVPGTLRALSAEVQRLEVELVEEREKTASYRLDERARSIASNMQRKGLEPDLSMEEKVAFVKEKVDRIDALEEAIKMASIQVEIGRFSDEPAKGYDSKTNLENFILTGEA